MNFTAELVMPTKRLQLQSSSKDSSVTYLRMKNMTRKNRQLKLGHDNNLILFVSENLSPLTRDWHESLKEVMRARKSAFVHFEQVNAGRVVGGISKFNSIHFNASYSFFIVDSAFGDSIYCP